MKQEKVDSEKIILSEQLFDGKKAILIKHQNKIYRLMITRQGKLILNK